MRSFQRPAAAALAPRRQPHSQPVRSIYECASHNLGFLVGDKDTFTPVACGLTEASQGLGEILDMAGVEPELLPSYLQRLHNARRGLDLD